MNDQAHTFLAADVEMIRAHLAHITRRWPELDPGCLLEIVFLTAADDPQTRDTRRFRLDQLEEAAEHVAAMNASPSRARSVDRGRDVVSGDVRERARELIERANAALALPRAEGPLWTVPEPQPAIDAARTPQGRSCARGVCQPAEWFDGFLVRERGAARQGHRAQADGRDGSRRQDIRECPDQDDLAL